MGSFTAELRVAGYVIPLIRCRYGVHQGTGQRGRASEKVRYDEPECWAVVQNHQFVENWAAHPTQQHEVWLVVSDDQGQAWESVHMKAAYCVHYEESFRAGEVGHGAYTCYFRLSDPGGYEIVKGGPPNLAAIRPLPGTHGVPQRAADLAADFIRSEKPKRPFAERPQSSKKGYLGSPKLSKPRLAALAKESEELYHAPVHTLKKAEMLELTGNPSVRAVFLTEVNPETGRRTGSIYVRKSATAYELTHEMMHAKQFNELGFEVYWTGQTSLQREEFVHRELMKNKHQFSAAETKHADDYLYFVRNGNWPNA